MFELDCERLELRRRGVPVPLQGLPRRLLVALVEHPGQVVERDALHLRLWDEGLYLDFQNSLNTAVRRLREALADDATNPRFVETVPRRGYRFVAPVEHIRDPGETEAGPAGPTLPVEARSARGRRLPLIAAGLIAVVLLFSWVMWRSTTHRRDGGESASLMEQARQHLDTRTHTGVERAIAYFQSALALETTEATEADAFRDWR